MDELKFKVSTGLKSILGQDLITSDNIAILELVKNSYDAHATRVVITFEDDALTVADNGKGMSLDDLQSKWLFVGYSAKSDGSEDASYRSKFKRNFAGAKGIGRISCDRLGSEVWLTTKSEESETVERIHVEWNKFEKSLKKEFDKIPVEHESLREEYIFPAGSNVGTEIRITGFRPDTPAWTKDKICELKKSLEKMINPFSDTEDFEIQIKAEAFEKNDKKLHAQIDNAGEDTPEEKVAQWKSDIVNGVIQNTIADVLSIKTTLLESRLANGVITTKLLDRGELMYEIQEVSTFDKLTDVTIFLYFLNHSAKITFSRRMGVTPVNYGNVMLFRNGFRVWPYGEPGDDSWKLDQRAQQGYNRFLGTRDLFGRVDVETTDVSAFKEVSSRDGGLIMTDAAKQLHEYFTLIHRRLERYVSGVLWGGTFLRNEYFKSTELALEARKKLQESDKTSDSSENLYKNIGSKVDFLQLIKSLVNDKNIVVKYYNSNLADVVSDVSYADVLQTDFVESLKNVAEKTSDESLAASIAFFEKRLEDMRKEKEAAEKQAEADRKAKLKAEREAKAANEAKEKAEKELEAKKQQNVYLESHRDTSKEVDDIMHTVLISSTELGSLVKILKILASEDIVDKRELLDTIKDIEFNVERIHMLSSLITKADVSILRDSIDLNIYEYTKEFLGIFGHSIKISLINNLSNEVLKKIQILEWTIILQNLVSNSKKADADTIQVTFTAEGRKLLLDFSDNGRGVNLDLFTPESIFDIGVTDRQGGSGIGLSTVKAAMRDKLNGSIEFLGNGLNGMIGATFRLTFE